MEGRGGKGRTSKGREGWESEGRNGKGRLRGSGRRRERVEKGEGGLDLNISPRVAEFLVTPLARLATPTALFSCRCRCIRVDTADTRSLHTCMHCASATDDITRRLTSPLLPLL